MTEQTSETSAQEFRAGQRQFQMDIQALGRELIEQRRHSLAIPEETWLAIAEQVMLSDWLTDRFIRRPVEGHG